MQGGGRSPIKQAQGLISKKTKCKLRTRAFPWHGLSALEEYAVAAPYAIGRLIPSRRLMPAQRLDVNGAAI